MAGRCSTLRHSDGAVAHFHLELGEFLRSRRRSSSPFPLRGQEKVQKSGDAWAQVLSGSPAWTETVKASRCGFPRTVPACAKPDPVEDFRVHHVCGHLADPRARIPSAVARAVPRPTSVVDASQCGVTITLSS
jgi:hypothetical protein